MKTHVLHVPQGPIPAAFYRQIQAVLQARGTIAYPTDTFYGLGVDATSPAAVDKVYALKSRDRGKPLSIIVSGAAMAEGLILDPPPVFSVLAREFWPGPLTLVFKARPIFPALMLGPGGTIAMRAPALPWLIKLLKCARFPITATSANITGVGESDDPAEVKRIFDGRVNLIVDGGRTPGGLPSTIVDLAGPKPKIFRLGAVSEDRLHPFIS